ncbi:MAG: hypothetical protein ABJA67_08435 [Chthonomonadales bacterium]
MDIEEIRSCILRLFPSGEESHIDIVINESGSFTAIEVLSDRTINRSFTGYFRPAGRIVVTLDPVLSLDQMRVFHDVVNGFLPRIGDAEDLQSNKFLVLIDGEYPQLFNDLDSFPNIHGNAREEMLPVLHAIEDLLKLNGYGLEKHTFDHKPTELQARRR